MGAHVRNKYGILEMVKHSLAIAQLDAAGYQEKLVRNGI